MSNIIIIHAATGGRRRSAGFTLIEVVLGISLMAASILGFSSFVLVSVRANRLNEMNVAANHAINGQLDSLYAMAFNNRGAAHSVARGVVYYLRELSLRLPEDDTYPVRVALDSSRDCIVYQFPVPEPGSSLSGILQVDGQPALDGGGSLKETSHPLGWGVVEVFLRESEVPEEFRVWDDITNFGGSDVHHESESQFYDMDGDGNGTSVFTNLMTVGSARKAEEYAASRLESLPVRITVRYYDTHIRRNETDRLTLLNEDRHPDSSVPGFDTSVLGGTSALSVSRSYIVNSSGVLQVGR